MTESDIPTSDPSPASVPTEDTADQPATRSPRKRRLRLVLLVGVLPLVALALGLAASIEVAYYGIGPGPAENVGEFVATDAVDTFAAEGDFYFLTVVQDELTALEYLEAQLDGKVDVLPRDAIRPRGVTPEQLTAQNRRSMEESKQQAIFVALTELGYEATLTGQGALVIGLTEESPAEGFLEPDDVIVAINGRPVSLASEAIAEVRVLKPRETVTLGIERPSDGQAQAKVLEVSITLGVHPEEPEQGFIGIYLETAGLVAEFPFEIDIDSRNIGGPSAGMMYTLGIINLLTDEDATKGHRIAGTGTIEFDGEVGQVGGVRQKVFAARDVGAEFVLVPERNFTEALDAAGDDIEVVAVASIDDALAFLESLPPAPASSAVAGG